jgi:hypothetical protein
VRGWWIEKNRTHSPSKKQFKNLIFKNQIWDFED